MDEILASSYCIFMKGLRVSTLRNQWLVPGTWRLHHWLSFQNDRCDSVRCDKTTATNNYFHCWLILRFFLLFLYNLILNLFSYYSLNRSNWEMLIQDGTFSFLVLSNYQSKTQTYSVNYQTWQKKIVAN